MISFFYLRSQDVKGSFSCAFPMGAVVWLPAGRGRDREERFTECVIDHCNPYNIFRFTISSSYVIVPELLAIVPVCLLFLSAVVPVCLSVCLLEKKP